MSFLSMRWPGMYPHSVIVERYKTLYPGEAHNRNHKSSSSIKFFWKGVRFMITRSVHSYTSQTLQDSSLIINDRLCC